jgi:hypothetical protein
MILPYTGNISCILFLFGRHIADKTNQVQEGGAVHRINRLYRVVLSDLHHDGNGDVRYGYAP